MTLQTQVGYNDSRNKQTKDKQMTIEIKNVIKGVVKNAARKTMTDDDLMKVMHAGGMIKDFFIKQTLVNGNFTIVAVGNNSGQNFVGISKRNPVDTYSALRGESIAASRAVKSALDAFMK